MTDPLGLAQNSCTRTAEARPQLLVLACYRVVWCSAPTAADDARGATGWPRGETCHVTNGALLRARLRHRVRTHGWSSGGACGVEGDRGAPSGAAAVYPAASSARVKPAPAKLGGGLRRQQAAGTSAGRPRGRQVNCTQQRAGWHLTSITSSVADDLPLLRAHFSWHNLAQVAWEGSRLPCCGCIGGRCSRRAFCLRRLPWRLVARA